MNKLKKANYEAFKRVQQLEKAIIHINAMGIEVQDIEFDLRFKPRIIVRENKIIHELLKEQKAVYFGTECRDYRRYDLVQFNAEGIRAICKLEKVH